MKVLRTRRRTLIVVLGLALTMAISALAWGGIATSPLGFKPLAGLGSCPLGTVIQVLAPPQYDRASPHALQRRGSSCYLNLATQIVRQLGDRIRAFSPPQASRFESLVAGQTQAHRV